MEVVKKFYVADYNLAEYYTIEKIKHIYFNNKTINKLYDLLEDPKAPRQKLNTDTLGRPRKRRRLYCMT